MIKRIRDTSRTLPRLHDTSAALPTVAPEVVARVLGAEMVGTIEQGGNPMAFYALREQLLTQRASSGGRPALKGTTRRQKIPLSQAQWEELDLLAARLVASGIRTTPGQVASVLLQQALLQVQSPNVLHNLTKGLPPEGEAEL